jgi:hypothetical protein
LAKYGGFAYENCGDGAKLDNFVPSRKKGRVGGVREEIELLGKRARSVDEPMMADNFLCMRTCVIQPQDLEEMLPQEGAAGVEGW